MVNYERCVHFHICRDIGGTFTHGPNAVGHIRFFMRLKAHKKPGL